MKKDVSSNAQDAGQTERTGAQCSYRWGKEKSYNSQAMGDLLNESQEQKAGKTKASKNRTISGTQAAENDNQRSYNFGLLHTV